jgi:hypothetical protein
LQNPGFRHFGFRLSAFAPPRAPAPFPRALRSLQPPPSLLRASCGVWCWCWRRRSAATASSGQRLRCGGGGGSHSHLRSLHTTSHQPLSHRQPPPTRLYFFNRALCAVMNTMGLYRTNELSLCYLKCMFHHFFVGGRTPAARSTPSTTSPPVSAGFGALARLLALPPLRHRISVTTSRWPSGVTTGSSRGISAPSLGSRRSPTAVRAARRTAGAVSRANWDAKGLGADGLGSC